MSWHRHCYEFLSLSEAVAIIASGRDYPFKFCAICGKVPTSAVAEDPPYGSSLAVVDLATPIDGRSMLQISRDALKAEMERK